MAELTPQQKIALIQENLQEVLNPEIIEDIIVKQNKPLKIYWGIDSDLVLKLFRFRLTHGPS